MTHDDSHDLTRRFLLRGSAGAALGLFGGFSTLALARPKATKASSTKNKSSTKRSRSSSRKKKATATKTRKGAPTISTSAQPLSDEEKALADAIADSVKHAVASAAARSGSRFAPGGFANIAQAYTRQLPSKGRRVAASKARRMLAAPVSVRRKTFGSFANAQASTHLKPLRPVAKAVAAAASQKLVSKWKAAAFSPPKGLTKIPRPYKRVGFFLNEVRCKEETDEIGADQIIIGGLAVSPRGVIKKIKPFKVSNDFDQGETKSYYPPGHKKFNPADPYRGRHLVSFDLDPVAEGPYPAGYAIGIIMAEEDSGGFSEMLEGLWAEVAEAVKTSIEVVSASLGGFYGQIIGNLTAYVLDKLIGFLAQLFDNPDDLVDRIEGTLNLASPYESYFAELSGREPHTPSHVWAAKRQTWKFRGDGGYYKAKAHWRVWG